MIHEQSMLKEVHVRKREEDLNNLYLNLLVKVEQNFTSETKGVIFVVDPQYCLCCLK